MKILIVGDIHGDAAQVKYLSGIAEKNRIDTILSVGDFGYWPHIDPDFLTYTENKLAKRNQRLYWIDGNHENFDALYALPVGLSGLREISPNIYHIPRGRRWEWDGVSFMGFGGAPSIDKMWRTEGESWWPQEIPSKEDEDRVFNGPENCAQVLVMHDSPRFPNGLNDNYKNDAISQYNRKLMGAIADHVKPEVIFHGHYHHAWHGAYHGIPIVGLNMNGTYENSWHILDTEKFK